VQEQLEERQARRPRRFAVVAVALLLAGSTIDISVAVVIRSGKLFAKRIQLGGDLANVVQRNNDGDEFGFLDFGRKY